MAAEGEQLDAMPSVRHVLQRCTVLTFALYDDREYDDRIAVATRKAGHAGRHPVYWHSEQDAATLKVEQGQAPEAASHTATTVPKMVVMAVGWLNMGDDLLRRVPRLPYSH